MIKKIIKKIIYFNLILLFAFNLNAKEHSALSFGSPDAKIVVKVFSSLTCPHCAEFHKKIFNKLEKEFIQKNIVRYEHHSFPLDMAALNAEKVLLCIDKSKNRSNFLNEIYQKQDSWASGRDINSINLKLSKIAKNYHLNNDKINECLTSEKLEDKILKHRINANNKYSIKSTPTILINEKKYEGEHNYKDFKKAINKLL
tara:strand:+ start:2490 stop:3089 length:600 start_codon:yes stop_codon:yes gene_type:complete